MLFEDDGDILMWKKASEQEEKQKKHEVSAAFPLVFLKESYCRWKNPF